MRRFILTATALFSIIAAAAQGPRIYRTEFITYDKREDAVADKRSETANYTPFTPERIAIAGGEARFVQKITVDATMNDYNIFFHLENVGMAYTLFINNEAVAEVEDPYTPADFLLSPYLKQGVNELMIGVRQSRTPELQENIFQPEAEQFENSYLFAQRRLAVRDFDIVLEPDTTRQYGKLRLDVVVANDFNFKESIQVGFDIYNPKGKLMEYSVNEIEIDGHAMDTLHFNPDIYHAYEFKWGDGQPPLYDVMIYLKRNGMLWEYVPLKIGFGKTEYRDGNFYRFDKVLHVQKTPFNALDDRKQTYVEIEQLKLRGYNTLCPDYPQPKWFYDMCDEAGMFVIDRANINSPTDSNIRSVGGTPANDPALEEEYLTRVKSMYYRSRNHSCIIAFCLGGNPSGNGYNMYKAYEWLKSVEHRRPIIYEGAEGEWNNDLR